MTDLSTVPSLPGVYIFRDGTGKVLYIGKAKNLRNRLRSYFQSDNLDLRKSKMVKLIKDFSYIVTSNEFEAFVLEANLIKQHKPSFNILLRDDKTYPYLRITITETWPKIEVVRKPKKDGNLYFGPYVPAQSMWETLSFIRRNFRIRTCKYKLNNNMRPCVQYQMKRCPAPCAGLITREEYMKEVNEVVLFLKGQKTELLNILFEKMKRFSDELKFEAAANIRDQIKRIEKIFAKQRVVSYTLDEIDIIGIYIEDSKISVNTLFVRNGLLIGSNDWIITNAFYETKEELIYAVVKAIYSKETLIPPPIILLEDLPESLIEIKEWLREKRGGFVEIKTPSTEEEIALFDMSLNNAKIHLKSKFSPLEVSLEELKQRLNLSQIPSKIGAFDVSTLFGSYSVGSFIYWQDGYFNKDLYRHLRIKQSYGIDDYSAMREIVLRVIKKKDLPKLDLILIDGGLGHLNTVMKVISELKEKYNVFAIAKNPDRLVFHDGREMILEDKRPSSLLLKKIRNEAHRFAISYHKKLRKKVTFKSLLEKIPGIGKKRRFTLLKHFGNISKIKSATVEEIASLKGFNLKLARKVIEELNKI